MKEVTESDLVICHFFHPEFRRCEIVDKHLTLIAPKYLKTKFIKLNVLLATFFVAKLQIKVLPAIVMFKKGLAVDRYGSAHRWRNSTDILCVALLGLTSLVVWMILQPSPWKEDWALLVCAWSMFKAEVGRNDSI